jgi:Insertion element 4 transposase N-terminal/Transposase DDE domain
VILPPPPRQPDPLALLPRRPRPADANIPAALALVNSSPLPPPPKDVLDRLRPLYQLLPLATVLQALHATGRHSRRQRDLPAHAVLWLAVAQSLFRDRSLPMVWRHLHSARDAAEPDDSAFTHARKRLGAAPLRLLFGCLAAPLGEPGLRSAFHRRWRLFALDGSVFELADTPANRAHFGSSSNQHKDGAFPQLQALALCEVGTHALLDFEFGPYHASELALSERLLRRLPAGVLLLMDRGLSYYEQVRLAVERGSHVLARVKAEQRALPVEAALPDGSYRSTIYPSFNDRRAGRGGIRVRVVRYTHDDPGRDGCGQETALLTTVLEPAELSAREAIALYPWRWEEESTLKEVKEVLLQGKLPLLRSKTPELVEQELYGLLLAHYVVRSVMAAGAAQAEAEPCRLSFKRSQEILEDYLAERPGRGGERGWLRRLVAEVSRQELRPKGRRSNPRVKKVTRCKWRGKRAADKGRVHGRPFAEVCRVVVPEAAGAEQAEGRPRPSGGRGKPKGAGGGRRAKGSGKGPAARGQAYRLPRRSRP